MGNDPINFRDPTGLSQSGNPLNNLFNGGFGGNVVRQENTALRNLNTNLLASPNLNYNSLNSPITSGPVRSTNTLRGLGNVASSVASSTLRTFNPVANTVVSAGLGLGAATLKALPPVQPKRAPINDAPQLVHQITPGVPIAPRDVRDLPGIRPVIDNPQRFVAANHSNQGHFVVDTKDLSVRFVTGEAYLPIDERIRRSQIEGRTAAGQAQFLTVVQEGLVTFSPFHETGRDLSILLTGKDYLVDPSVRYTTDDRFNAGKMLLLPAANSGQIRYADEVLDGLQVRGRTLGQQQGREFRVDQLQLYEFDANQPKHVRGFLQNERRRLEGSGGGLSETATPPGYVQAHGRATPAREGYDYSNSSLQGIDLNKLEERIRRRTGKQ